MPTFAIDELDTEQEPQITAHGFFASPLTDNIQERPDGSLLVENCPIARTGFQSYSIRDLPQQAARKLGLDLSNPSANIDLYRPASEVFAPAFIASLEGASICDNHPPDFITPETFSKYSQGHIQNVHKGPEQLEDGEWPLIADLVISGEPLVGKVRRKEARENSLGYDFSIRCEGNKIIQCDMVGNHNAVVPKGRAGDDVRINDAAPDDPPRAESPPKTLSAETLPPSAGAVPRTAATSTSTAVQPEKEKKPVSNLLKHLHGLALKAFATDADPEKMAEAAEALSETPPDAAEDARRGRDRKGKDADPDLYEETLTQDRKARDRRSRDEAVIDPTDEDHEPAGDRKVMHDALDKLLDAQDAKRGRDRKAGDADIAALKDLLNDFFTEEEAEPEHQAADADPAELEEVLGAGEEPDAEDEADPGEELEPSGEENLAEDRFVPDPATGGRLGKCSACGARLREGDLECPDCGAETGTAMDDEPMAEDRKVRDRARAADGVRATLAMLRPFVARSNDAAVKKAFNTALGTLRSSRASVGDYAEFGRASRAVNKKAVGNPPPTRARAADSGGEDPNAKLQKVYDDLRAKGGK